MSSTSHVQCIIYSTSSVRPISSPTTGTGGVGIFCNCYQQFIEMITYGDISSLSNTNSAIDHLCTGDPMISHVSSPILTIFLRLQFPTHPQSRQPLTHRLLSHAPTFYLTSHAYSLSTHSYHLQNRVRFESFNILPSPFKKPRTDLQHRNSTDHILIAPRTSLQHPK